jgi:hypothetical protein
MDGKIDKFTAARIRLFTRTGMASQRRLPFDRPSVVSFRWTPATMLKAANPARRGRRRSPVRVGA